MQGACSDLKLGLPLQSVNQSDKVRLHEPMRLMALIKAPLSAIDGILVKHQNVRSLVKNRWIRLIAMDPATGRFFQAEDAGDWREIRTPSTERKVEIKEASDRKIEMQLL